MAVGQASTSGWLAPGSPQRGWTTPGPGEGEPRGWQSTGEELRPSRGADRPRRGALQPCRGSCGAGERSPALSQGSAASPDTALTIGWQRTASLRLPPAASPTRREDTPAGRGFCSAWEDILNGEPDPAPGVRALGAEKSPHTRRSGRGLGAGKRTVPLRRKRLTEGRRKPSALRAWQRVKEQHSPRPGLTGPAAPAAVSTSALPESRGAAPWLKQRENGGWVRERRAGERSPLHAPHGRRTPIPAPEQREGTMGPRIYRPRGGKRESAGRESPRLSPFLPGAGRGSAAAAGPTANPVPPRGRRRAEGRNGGGRSPGTASSQPHGGTLLAAAGSHPPLPPGRLPLPWPPSPPARQSRARRSLPPSPSSRCMGSGAQRGAEPSGGAAAARSLTSSPPAAIPPAAGAINPCGAAQAGLPCPAEPPPAPAEASVSRRRSLGLPHPPAPRPPYGGPETGGGGAGPRRGRPARNGGGGECPRYRATRAPRTHRSPPYPPPWFSSRRRKGKLVDETKDRELQWVGLPDPWDPLGISTEVFKDKATVPLPSWGCWTGGVTSPSPSPVERFGRRFCCELLLDWLIFRACFQSLCEGGHSQAQCFGTSQTRCWSPSWAGAVLYHSRWILKPNPVQDSFQRKVLAPELNPLPQRLNAPHPGAPRTAPLQRMFLAVLLYCFAVATGTYTKSKSKCTAT